MNQIPSVFATAVLITGLITGCARENDSESTVQSSSVSNEERIRQQLGFQPVEPTTQQPSASKFVPIEDGDSDDDGEGDDADDGSAASDRKYPFQVNTCPPTDRKCLYNHLGRKNKFLQECRDLGYGPTSGRGGGGGGAVAPDTSAQERCMDLLWAELGHAYVNRSCFRGCHDGQNAQRIDQVSPMAFRLMIQDGFTRNKEKSEILNKAQLDDEKIQALERYLREVSKSRFVPPRDG